MITEYKVGDKAWLVDPRTDPPHTYGAVEITGIKNPDALPDEREFRCLGIPGPNWYAVGVVIKVKGQPRYPTTAHYRQLRPLEDMALDRA